MTTTPTTIARGTGTDLHRLAARWPQFSPRELRRLDVLAYRRRTGRLRPATPVQAAGDALCAALAAHCMCMAPPLPVHPPALLRGPGDPQAEDAAGDRLQRRPDGRR